MRLIDGDKLLEYLFSKQDEDIDIAKEIAEFPEVKPKEGRWSKSDDGYECSECEWYSLYDSPWCPWCGAKMKGEEE